MAPKSLRTKLLLIVSVLAIASGVVISQLVTHRYSGSLFRGAVAQAENISHSLTLDAADKILVNDTSFKCRCIVRVEDPTKWDESFVTVFAARLAAELAYSITDSRTVAADKWELYRLKYRQATGVDAQEGTPLELLTDEWLDSRSGGVITPRAN